MKSLRWAQRVREGVRAARVGFRARPQLLHAPSHEGTPHIALFLPCLSGGGAQRVMVTFANELAALGLRVDLVLGSAVGPYRDEISPAVTLFELGSPRVSRCLLPLARYLREHRPKWLLSTLLDANIIAMVSKYLSGTTTRIWLRESTTLSRAWVDETSLVANAYNLAAKLIYARADGVIAPSQGVADDLRIVSGPEIEKRLHVLVNPIATAEIAKLAREPVPAALEQIPGPWIVGCGRLYDAKGFDVLIRAVAELEMLSTPRPSLLILGEGPDRVALQQLATAVGIGERTHFPGFFNNPFCVLDRAAVFVLSSNLEGCPNVLLQAMACGTSVVSTDCPSGPREILRSESEGILVPVGDVHGLARAIARQLEHPGDPQVIRERAEAFAAPAVALQLWQLLRGTST